MGLCSMCQHGTTKHEKCEKCGETFCLHLWREHKGKCAGKEGR
jgi:hypothetical protein